MLCDGSPDPTVAREINTYMNLWREDLENIDIDTVLRDGKLTLNVSSPYSHLHWKTHFLSNFCSSLTNRCTNPMSSYIMTWPVLLFLLLCLLCLLPPCSLSSSPSSSSTRTPKCCKKLSSKIYFRVMKSAPV